MGTIATLKEQEVLETPLLLFECELPSGATERWSTNAVQMNGDSYEPRVLGHNVLEMRALSEEGIDAVSRVSITLANADSHFSQIARTVGWKGSRLTVRFLFFNLVAGTPASEDAVLFRGVANPPDEITETTCRLTFLNRLGLYRILLPEIRIQRRCPWTFPSTEQQRNEAITGGMKGRSYRDAPEVDGEVIVGDCRGDPGDFVEVLITAGEVHDLRGQVVRGQAPRKLQSATR